MSIPLTIQGTPINFPSTSASPDWSAAVIQFAQATTNAFQGLIGAFDISPQIYTMTSNSNTNLAVPNLLFSTANVRGVQINYTIFRTTSSANESEFGRIDLVYNPNNSAGSLWELSRESTGNSSITFNVTDTGQVQFTSQVLAGSNHSGVIGFYAKTIQQSY